MKNLFIAIGTLFALVIVGRVYAAPNPPALGGTGTNIIPASGTVPIGNGSGTYTPAHLTPGSNVVITNASGSITIAVPITSSSLGIVPPGPAGAVQYNNGGTLGGTAGVTISSSTNQLNASSVFTGLAASNYIEGFVLDTGGQVFNVKGYGAKCDDVTDDTTPINNAIAAAMAGNGTTTNTIYVPGMCLMKGAMVIPYKSAGNLPYQNPLRITGPAESWNGYWQGTTLNNYQGGGLDLQYNAPTSTSIGTSTAVAKIDTRGAGLLEIDHLTLKDASSDNSLFFQTTNTTVILHDLVFAGNPNCFQMTCTQPAIALGGFNSTSSVLQTSSSAAGFQGYGSELYNIYFQNVDRAITFGAAVNGIMVRNMTVSKTSGGAESSSAPFYFNGGNSGNVIVGGTIEITGYHYMVFGGTSNGSGGNGNTFMAMGMYDDTASTTGYIWFGPNFDYNTVFLGYLDPALQAASTTLGPDAVDQTVFSGSQNIPTTAAPAGFQSSKYIVNPNGLITTATNAVPTGGGLTIDTGSGGSYLYTKAYSNRFQDQSGNTKAEIEAGAAGGSAYFLGPVSIGTSTLTGQELNVRGGIQINPNASITDATNDVPTGGNMTIDTGSGGSFLNTKAFSNQIEDQSGNVKAVISAGGGGTAYFLGKVGAGTSQSSSSLQVIDSANNSSTVLIGASSTKSGCLEFGAASGTIGKLVFVWFDSNAAINATTTKPAFCM